MKKKIMIIIATLVTATALVGCASNSKKEDGNSAQNNSSVSDSSEDKKTEDESTAKEVSTASIAAEIKGAIEMKKTAPVDEELAKEKFHLNLEDVEEYTIENGMMNTGLETVAVVKAKPGKVDAVKESLEKAKEDKKASAFYPGEPEAVDAAEIKVIGDYVGLFIIPDDEEANTNNSAKALEIFENALK